MGRAYIISGNAQREERCEYPLQALREIVVNIIVHRDYMKSNDSVIKFFDDRIVTVQPFLDRINRIDRNFFSSCRSFSSDS